MAAPASALVLAYALILDPVFLFRGPGKERRAFMDAVRVGQKVSTVHILAHDDKPDDWTRPQAPDTVATIYPGLQRRHTCGQKSLYPSFICGNLKVYPD